MPVLGQAGDPVVAGGRAGVTSTALALRSDTFLLDPEELFAQVDPRPVPLLFDEYDRTLAAITGVSEYATRNIDARIMGYFFAGNGGDNHSLYSLVASRLFGLEGAVKALDAEFWQRAMDMTDVLQHMTAKRRNEWQALIREHKTPPFTRENVASTLSDLLDKRADLLGERVEQLFHALSGEHLTNRPQGFGKRMILRYVHHEGATYNSRDTEYIADLRAVVAKFMGRPEPHYSVVSQAVRTALEQRGEWIDLDGGALRLRVYLKGTGHLEVHPDMAWRLNAVLHQRQPRAIPASYRTKPTRVDKTWKPIQRPLPWPVLSYLALMRPERDGRSFRLSYYSDHDDSAAVREEAHEVLRYLGAVIDGNEVRFAYCASEALNLVVSSGTLPDQWTHQYYPTPDHLALRVAGILDAQPGHSVLEPSAGTGSLARHLPSSTCCVEISALHCGVLRGMGFAEVHSVDFLEFAPYRQFDRIAMNPPFAAGQWQSHVIAASRRLTRGGRLVAILPASAQKSLDLGSEFACTWSEDLEFPGVSIAVVILTAERA